LSTTIKRAGQIEQGSFAAEASLGRVMNDQGYVAGTSLLAGDENSASLLWSNNQMTDLGSLGGNATEACAINNNDQVVGRSRTTNTPGSHHSLLWENGQMIDLGVVAPCARGIAEALGKSRTLVAGVITAVRRCTAVRCGRFSAAIGGLNDCEFVRKMRAWPQWLRHATRKLDSERRRGALLSPRVQRPRRAHRPR
jgi:probable HAF family extracellular repeat protein